MEIPRVTLSWVPSVPVDDLLRAVPPAPSSPDPESSLLDLEGLDLLLPSGGPQEPPVAVPPETPEPGVYCQPPATTEEAALPHEGNGTLAEQPQDGCLELHPEEEWGDISLD